MKDHFIVKIVMVIVSLGVHESMHASLSRLRRSSDSVVLGITCDEVQNEPSKFLNDMRRFSNEVAADENLTKTVFMNKLTDLQMRFIAIQPQLSPVAKKIAQQSLINLYGISQLE